jgi:hypothetical protein
MNNKEKVAVKNATLTAIIIAIMLLCCCAGCTGSKYNTGITNGCMGKRSGLVGYN